jgi:acyl-coenzyme A synthetase/AMP-(fatty) acid ligase
VRGRLAPYEYPREIEFIDALPMTTTGKVQRKELRKREEGKLRTTGATKWRSTWRGLPSAPKLNSCPAR